MIFKRYGTSYRSVAPNFDSRSLNEIGFRRDREKEIPVEEFEAGFEHVVSHELGAEAEGPVQDHTEQLLLDRLEAKLLELEATLGGQDVLVVESGDGQGYPKTRQKTKTVVDEGASRLHFMYTVSPPLKVGVYRQKA